MDRNDEDLSSHVETLKEEKKKMVSSPKVPTDRNVGRFNSSFSPVKTKDVQQKFLLYIVLNLLVLSFHLRLSTLSTP